jgi:outer membrane protein assembly factor BamE (lipoprotein component of BamABCDE complex)
MTEKSSLPLMLIAALAAIAAGSVATMARADLVVNDDQVSVIPSDIARPSPGMTMQKVEEKFGAPSTRHDAVGTPPITRWDYQSFSVYFENDRVIHAVVTDTAPATAPAPSSAPAS